MAKAAARRRPVARRAGTLVLVMSLAGLAVAACSGGASQSPSAAGSRITVSDAWARPSMSMQGSIAVYFVLKNAGDADDALVKAETAVGTASLHETVAGDSGMMGMQPVDRIAIAKGGTTELKPGGYHLMVEKLTQAVAPGSTVEVTLTFEHAPKQVIKAEVRAN